MQLSCRGSWWNPETWVLSCNLRHLSMCHVDALTIFLYFFINVKTIMLPSLTFRQADLSTWQCKLSIGVCDRTLKLWCSHAIWDISVHVIDMDLIFSSIYSLKLNRRCYQVAAWKCELRIGVHDRTLNLGCSHAFWYILVHITDTFLLFSLFLH